MTEEAVGDSRNGTFQKQPLKAEEKYSWQDDRQPENMVPNSAHQAVVIVEQEREPFSYQFSAA